MDLELIRRLKYADEDKQRAITDAVIKARYEERDRMASEIAAARDAQKIVGLLRQAVRPSDRFDGLAAVGVIREEQDTVDAAFAAYLTRQAQK